VLGIATDLDDLKNLTLRVSGTTARPDARSVRMIWTRLVAVESTGRGEPVLTGLPRRSD